MAENSQDKDQQSKKNKGDQLEQNKTERQYTTNGRVALIGFFGGLIWGGLGYLFFLLNFTTYGLALILRPWAFEKELIEGGSGQLLGLIFLCIVSTILAFIYKVTMGRVKSMWVGVAFGIALWVVVFYVLQPWIPTLKPVLELGRNTVSTTLSLFTLWGLFVGYSISFDLGTVESSSDYYAKVNERQVKAKE